MCICPENYLNSFFFMHQIYLPKLYVLTLTVELFPRDFAAKNTSFHTLDPVGRSWEKQAKNIVVFSEFISSFKLTYGVAEISRVGLLALGSFRWLVVDL